MKPTLLILAAGMGSRYGGLKQIDGIFQLFQIWRSFLIIFYLKLRSSTPKYPCRQVLRAVEVNVA